MLGTVILKRRKDLGLSQREVARRAGLSSPYIANLESGRTENPTVAALVGLAHALELSLEELMHEAGIIDLLIRRHDPFEGLTIPKRQVARVVIDALKMADVPKM